MAKAILHGDAKDAFELCFVWNRTVDKITADSDINSSLILENLDDFATRDADLIVEVSHPSITIKYGEAFLQHADFMAGSPTAFADSDFETRVRKLANEGAHGLSLLTDLQLCAERGPLGRQRH